MKNKILLLLLPMLFIWISGCSSVSGHLREQMSGLPGQYASFDLKLGWEVKKVGDQLFVDGIVKNVRYAYVEDLEIWVSPKDRNGNSLAPPASDFIQGNLRLDDYAGFSLKLPATTTPVATLVFTYRYTGLDGGEDGGGIPWMNSFIADLKQ